MTETTTKKEDSRRKQSLYGKEKLVYNKKYGKKPNGKQRKCEKLWNWNLMSK